MVRTSGFHPDNMGSIPVGDVENPNRDDWDFFCSNIFFLEISQIIIENIL